jgi:MFS transporter, PPP family, 3-phenylpropionic acid transporter
MRSARPGALPAFIVLYAVMYAAFGVASPFWPLFFESRGVAAEEIGALFGAAIMMRLVVGPVVGRIADMLGALRAALAVCALAAACLSLGLLAANGFWLLAAVELAHGASLAPVTTLADALALNAAKPRRADGFEYGWVRGAASAAFIAGTLIAGQLISSAGLSLVPWMHSVLLVGAALSTGFVPGLQTPPAAASDGTLSAFGGVQALWRNSAFRRVLLVAGLIYGSHAMQDTFAVIRWNAAGISSAASSVLWAESVAAEVVVFLLIGPALLDRIGPRGAAALAALAGIVRWTVMAETTALPALALVQPLHGLTFALLHLSCLRLIAVLAPPHLAATAQAFYAFAVGSATAVLTLLSGTLYEQQGAQAFLLMALLCAAALPFALRLRAGTTSIQ